MARRREFLGANMWTVGPLAPLMAWWQSDVVDGNGRRALDDDNCALGCTGARGANEG